VLDEEMAPGRPFVAVSWHQDILFTLDFFRRRSIVVMVSRSKDGELVADTLHRLGYRTVRGSSSAGGREALHELVDRLRAGSGTAIIADGPRGPAGVSKIGCVVAARETGAPILPISASVEPCVRLRNWDRTAIALPFSRVVLGFGDPIRVPMDATREDCERWRDVVDERMKALEATCRRASRASGTTAGPGA
jgi:hypothetical protein